MATPTTVHRLRRLHCWYRWWCSTRECFYVMCRCRRPLSQCAGYAGRQGGVQPRARELERSKLKVLLGYEAGSIVSSHRWALPRMGGWQKCRQFHALSLLSADTALLRIRFPTEVCVVRPMMPAKSDEPTPVALNPICNTGRKRWQERRGVVRTGRDWRVKKNWQNPVPLIIEDRTAARIKHTTKKLYTHPRGPARHSCVVGGVRFVLTMRVFILFSFACFFGTCTQNTTGSSALQGILE